MDSSLPQTFNLMILWPPTFEPACLDSPLQLSVGVAVQSLLINLSHNIFNTAIIQFDVFLRMDYDILNALPGPVVFAIFYAAISSQDSHACKQEEVTEFMPTKHMKPTVATSFLHLRDGLAPEPRRACA